jgi:hypothetical protein
MAEKSQRRLDVLLVLAGLFIGLGIGIAADSVAAGIMIGLGAGFFAAFVAAAAKMT